MRHEVHSLLLQVDNFEYTSKSNLNFKLESKATNVLKQASRQVTFNNHFVVYIKNQWDLNVH